MSPQSRAQQLLLSLYRGVLVRQHDLVARRAMIIEPLPLRMLLSATPSGNELLLNSTTTDFQQNARIVVDSSGGAVVVWQSANQDGSGWGVYGQRIDSGGNAISSEFLINQTTAGDQSQPDISIDASDNFAVVWTTNQNSTNDIFGRLYNADGTPKTNEFLINKTTAGAQQNPSIAVASGGNMIVAWDGSSTGDSAGIYARSISSAGAFLDANDVLVNTTTTGTQDSPSVAVNASGEAVFAWTDRSGTYSQIKYRRRNSAGSFVAAEAVAGAGAAQNEDDAAAGIDSGNNFVIAFTKNDGGGGTWNIYRRHFFASPSSSTLALVNTSTAQPQQRSAIAMKGDGHYAIVWSSMQQDSDQLGIYGQQYNADGSTDGGEFLINTTVIAGQDNAAIAWQSNRMTVAWNGNGPGDIDGIFAQAFDTDAAVNEAPINSVPGPQTTPEDTQLIFSAANGNAITVTDYDAGSGAVKLTLTVTSGSLTLATTSGLSFITGDGTSDATMTFTGTVAAINTALDGLRFQPAANATGTVTLTIDTDDQGNTGSGGALTDSDSTSINVTAVNDAPVVALSSGTLSYTENSGAVVVDGGLTVSDVDNATLSSATVRVVGYVSGQDVLAGVSQNGITASWDSSTGILTLSGVATLADYQGALRAVTYQNTSDAPSTAARSISFTINDGAANSSAATATLSVSAVNDGPLNTVPSSPSTNEDTALVFSSANGNAISISDVDAGSSAVRVTLSVTSGTLTLSTTSGLSFTAGDGSADATMTFTGTVAAINTALNGMSFAPAANANGTVTLAVTTNDQGNTGSGGALVDTDNVSIDVAAINDAPVNQVPGAQTINEDSILTFTGGNSITVADVDAGSNAISVGLTVTNGTLSLASTAGLSFTTGDGSADVTMTFTGTISAINTAMSGMTFTPTANFNGSASLQIVSNDLGNSGAGGSLSDSDTVAITVSAINDAPVNTVPGAQSIAEDTTLVFSSSGANGISVADVDAGSASVKITLSATNGTLTLSRTTGLSFTSGDGTSDASMVFTGSLTNVNAALDGLSYVPTANYNGSASVSLTTSDQGNTGSGGTLTANSTVNVTISAVNDAPVNIAPTSVSVNEDNNFTFSGGNTLSVSDVDATSAQIVLNASNGTLTLSRTTGLTFAAGDGTADATMTFTGTIANINAALSGMSFTPATNYNGSASLQMISDDQGATGSGGALNTSSTITINVIAVNDAPLVTLSSNTFSYTENSGAVVVDAGLTLSDVDSATLSSASVRVVGYVSGQDVLSGTSQNGITASWNSSTGILTLTGVATLAQYQDALRAVTYQNTSDAPSTAARSISFTVNDGAASSASASATLAISPVNDAPSNIVPSAQSTNEDTPLVFSSANGNAISISDIDAGSGAVKIILSVTSGTLTLSTTSGLSFTTGDGTADAAMTFAGTVAAINNALGGMSFQPAADASGAVTLSITTDDQGNTGSGGSLTDSDTVSINVAAVNDAPVNHVPSAQTINEDSVLTFSSGNGNAITLTDVDAGGASVSVTLTATNGTLTLASTTGLTFTTGDGAADPLISIVGTLTDINAAMAGMTFTPTANFNGSSSVQIASNDQGNSGAGGSLSDSDTVSISVSAVNDAPVNTVPAAQTTAEDTPLTFSASGGNAISIADVDAGAASVRVILSSTNGTLTLSRTTGLSFSGGSDGTADAVMTFTGSITNSNAALDGLSYSPGANYNGSATLTLVTNDLGNTGGGGALTATSNVNITVSAVNDAPAVAAPASASVNEDTTLTFNTIVVSDVDAASAQMTLAATNGTLTLSRTTSLTFTGGDGTADATMTFSGSIANINAALAGMTYAPAANYNGPASVVVMADDQGATGSGGALTTTATINITMIPVNDAPVVTLAAVSMSYTENAGAVVVDAGLTVSDIDNTTLSSATVRVVGYVSGQDVLSGTSQNGITASWNSSTGILTLSGVATLAQYETALRGVTYTNTSDAPSTAARSISFTVNDGAANSSSPSVPLSIAPANDAPINIVPSSQSTNEDTALVFSSANGNAIAINDIDAGSGSLKVTLTVTSGTLTLSTTTGLSFTAGDGTADGTMTFTGTVAAINAALSGMSFAPVADASGSVTFTINTDDQANSGSGGALIDSDSFNIDVIAVNDAPVNHLPATQSVNEDSTLTLSSGAGNAITVTDVDVAGGTTRISMIVAGGTITLGSTTGLTFTAGDGTSDSLVTLLGTLVDVNAAMNGMTFTPSQDFNGAATLQISSSDQGNSGTGGDKFDIDVLTINVAAVNDAPTLTVPPDQQMNEDVPLTFSSAAGTLIAVADVDAGTVRVTLSATNGTVTLFKKTGLTFITGDGTADVAMTFTGTPANVNAAMDGMTFTSTANYNGAASLAVTVNDMGNTGTGGAKSASATVNLTVQPVNDAPAIVLSSGTMSYTENGGAVAIDGSLTTSDIDNTTLQGATVQIIGYVAGQDVLNVAAQNGITPSWDSNTGILTLTGSATLLQYRNILRGVTYQNTSDAPSTAARAIRFTVNDGAADSAAADCALTVNAVNDGPTLSVPGNQSINEDQPLTFSAAGLTAITVNDVDAGTLRVTVASINGTFSLATTSGLTFSAGDGVSDSTMTFNGTIADINTALEGGVFTPTANFSGAASVAVTVNDQGRTGSGGTLTATKTVNITVAAQNDAPVVSVPGPQSIRANGLMVFDNKAPITISDVDAGASTLRITLAATNGVLTLSRITGLTFTTGDGTSDANMVFTGTLTNINAAIFNMTFTPAQNFLGPGVVQVTANDLGNSGAGGAQSDTDSVIVEMANEFRANSTLVNTQNQPAVAVDETGAFVVTWVSSAQDGNGLGIYAQRFDSTGIAVGPEFQVNQTTNSDQTAPQIGIDRNGSIVITWASNNQDGSGWGIYARQFDAMGNALGNEFRVNTTTSGNQTQPIVAVAESGTFLIAWRSDQNGGSGNGGDIYAQRFGADGAALGGEFRVNASTSNTQDQPAAAVDGDHYMIVWRSNKQDGSGAGVFARVYDLDGNALTGDVQANSTNSGNQDKPFVAGGYGSGFVVVWASGNNQDGDKKGVYFRRFTSAGVALGTETLANTTITDNQDKPSVAMDLTGAFIVTWSSNLQDGSSTGIYGQKFDPAGGRRGVEFQISGTTINAQDQSAVASSPYADIAVVWQGSGVGDASGVFGQFYPAPNASPINHPPVAQSVAEDNVLTFSAATGNAITITDSDGASDVDQFTIVASNGVLSLAQTTGLTFTVGDGTADTAMAFAGTLAQLNAALNGLTFTPSTNYFGSVTIDISTTDQGLIPRTDNDRMSLTVTPVNDAPTLVGGPDVVVNEDSPNSVIDLTPIFDDVDDVSLDYGIFANTNPSLFDGVTVDLSTGKLTLDYAADANGTGQITIRATDSGGLFADWTFNVTVNAVNDPPTITMPSPQTTFEDTPLVLSNAQGNAISVGDVDLGSGELQAVLTVTHGTVTFASTTGLSFTTGDGVADTGMSFSATAADLNAALDGMTFTPDADYNGNASIQLMVNDQGATGSGGAKSAAKTLSIAITPVNDAPVLLGADNFAAINEDSVNNTGTLVSALIASHVADVDSGALSGIAVIGIDNSNGVWQFSTNGGSTWTNFGAPTATTARLLAANANTRIRFVPAANFNGVVDPGITFRAWDQTTGSNGGVANVTINGGATAFSSDTTTASLTVNAVNDAPVNTIPASQTINEDQNLVFSSGNGNQISVADVDGNEGTGIVRLTLNATHGVLTLSGISGLSFVTGDGTADATMTFTGTLFNVNAALNGLIFAPTADYNGPANIQVDLSDQGNTGSGGTLTDSDTIDITISPVNDAPVLAGTNNLTAINEDDTTSTGALVSTLIAGQISDVDAAPLMGIAVTAVDNSNGNWQYSTNGGSSWNNFGSVSASAARLLASNASTRVRFVPNANYNGTVSGITFRAWDQTSGTAGSTANVSSNGGATAFSSTTATASITVSAVNDPPVVSAPSTATANEDVQIVFSAANANAITVSDVDAAGNPLTITLTASHGLLTLGNTTGLTFVTGSGVGDGTMTFTGVASDINVALDGLTFAPDADYNGAAAVQLSADDNGSSGAGGPQTTNKSIAITIQAVNDAPTLVGSNDFADIDEDQISNAGQLVSQLISGHVTDVDAAALSGIAVTSIDNSNGVWQFSTNGGTTWSDFGSPSSTAARLLAANASTRVRFVPNANYNGAIDPGISFAAWDQTTGSNGSVADITTAGGQSAFSTTAATAAISVAAVNDAPTLSIPGLQSTTEDANLIFSAANGNSITVGDVDGNTASITLIATHGTLTLGSHVAVTNLTFTDTLANINVALEGLIFTPTPRFAGVGMIQIVVDDLGNTGSGGDRVASDVISIDIGHFNHGPTSTAINDVHLLEDAVETKIDLLSHFADYEDAAADLAYTVIGDTNAALFSNLHYDAATGALVLDLAHDAYGSATLTIRATDTGGLSTSVSFNVTVDPVNDAPVIAANAAINLTANQTESAIASSNLSVADVDNADSSLTFTLAALPANGVLKLSGAPLALGGKFTQQDIDDARLSYEHTAVSENDTTDTFAFTVSDGSGGTIPATTFTITVAGTGPVTPPVITPPSYQPPPAPPVIPTPSSGNGDTDLLPQDGGSGTGTSGTPSQQPSHPAPNHSSSGSSTPAANPAGPVGEPVASINEDATPIPERAEPQQPLVQTQREVAPPVPRTIEAAPAPRVEAPPPPAPAPAPPPPAPPAHPEQVAFVAAPQSPLWKELDSMHEKITQEKHTLRLVAGSASFVSLGLSVIYILWTIRAGYLIAGLLSSMPAWRLVDPLPILDSLDGAKPHGRDEDDESLETLVDGKARSVT